MRIENWIEIRVRGSISPFTIWSCLIETNRFCNKWTNFFANEFRKDIMPIHGQRTTYNYIQLICNSILYDIFLFFPVFKGYFHIGVIKDQHRSTFHLVFEFVKENSCVIVFSWLSMKWRWWENAFIEEMMFILFVILEVCTLNLHAVVVMTDQSIPISNRLINIFISHSTLLAFCKEMLKDMQRYFTMLIWKCKRWHRQFLLFFVYDVKNSANRQPPTSFVGLVAIYDALERLLI